MQMRKPINRLKHRCRCAFAILLSIPFIFNCFGFTAVAEDFASAPIEPSEPFDEISEELEEPPEEIEFPLEPESLSGEEILSPTEEPEEQWLLDEELSADEPGFQKESDPDENQVSDETSTFEETSFPFEQTYTVSSRKITVTADAGVFPTDAELYVEGIDDAGIVQAMEQALDISDSDNVLIRHSLYSFSGSELLGTANVKVWPLGLETLREAYPEGSLISCIMCWDGDYPESWMIPADIDMDGDQADFELYTMGVYDLVVVIVLRKNLNLRKSRSQRKNPNSSQS